MPPRLTGKIKGLKLGLPKEYMIGGLDPEVKAAVDAAVKQFEKLGAEIVEISLPHTDYAVATYYIIATAEARRQPGAVRRHPLRRARGRQRSD